MQKKWSKTLTFSFQTTIIIVIIIVFPSFSYANNDSRYSACSLKHFNCGNFQNLTFPFWGNSRPSFCGHPSFKLDCDEKLNTTIIEIKSTKYRVIDLNVSSRILTIAGLDFAAETFCPDEYPNTVLDTNWFNYTSADNITTLFYDCPQQQYPHPLYEFSCDYYGIRRIGYLNITVDDQLKSQLKLRCKFSVIVPILEERIDDLSHGLESVRDVINGGFEVKYGIDPLDHENCVGCNRTGGACGYNSTKVFICFCENGDHSMNCLDQALPQPPPPLPPSNDDARSSKAGKNKTWLKFLVGIGGVIFGILSISIIIWCLVGKGASSNDENVEAFMKQHGSLALKRYSYSDTKKITFSLKEKLGQGGYGGVYKGKLPDGRLVAVKILKESKGNGEEFINEVASISKTSHVNVVNLFGYCFEGNKRALIYEFMPNGSLEKFKDDRHLGLEKIYQIANGIARGLEYLHHGCNTQILHLDIKPHNILLDDEFCPKIADFGLAKLCSRKDSKLSSLLGARGTIGYIAPEVFNRSFGRVSHKSDIYSYGMMILEIVGGKPNIVDGFSEVSEVYFPDCFYKRIEVQNEFILAGVVTNEKENKIARKMILVGLWCIQTNPSHRPSIGKVIEMLEGSVEALQIPPRPVLSLPPRPSADAIPSSYLKTVSMSAS